MHSFVQQGKPLYKFGELKMHMSTRSFIFYREALLVTMILFGSAGMADAQATKNYSGANNGTWSTGSNWTPSGAPNNLAIVGFANTNTVRLNGNKNIAGLSSTIAGTIDLRQNALTLTDLFTGTQTFAGTITDSTIGNGVLIFGNPSSTGTQVLSGKLIGHQGPQVEGGVLQFTNGSNAYTGGTIIQGGELDATVAGALPKSTTGIAGSGDVAISGGTLKTTGNQTLGAGMLWATGGTLNIASGVFSATSSGPITLDTLQLGSGGALTLAGSPTVVTINSDYNNANTGAGNAFNNSANLTNTIVNAAANTSDAVSKSTIAFGNVHVGTSQNQAFTISNTSTSAVQIRGAVQTGNITSGALSLTNPGSANITTNGENFGPLAPAGVTGNYNVKYAPTAVGALSGQSVGVVSDFANVSTKSVAVTGAAYGYAVAGVTNAVTLGPVHVGGTDSQALSITNAAAADGYHEGLDATLGAATGAASASGVPITNLAAGGLNSTAFSVHLDSSTAGAKSGTVAVNFASDGATTSGLATSPLTGATVNVSGNVYNYADPSLQKTSGGGTFSKIDAANYILNFGTVGNGHSVSADLAILNGLIGGDPSGDFTDALGGSFNIGSGPFILGGFTPFGGVDAGSSYDDLTARFTVTTAGGFGAFTEYVTFNPLSENGAGLGNSGLGPITLEFTGTAVPEVSTWAMMMLGFAGLGFAGYRKARTGRTAFSGI
jgi:autotransporter-associated beta strand protein